MIDPDMQEIAGEFVIEARETLEALDGKFVELERRPSAELIDDIFRAMHTIKGAAGFLSLARIVEVAHAGEDVMGRLRSGGLALSESIVDAVLETVDVLKALIEDVASGADSGIATEGVVRRLRGILAEDGAAKAAEPVDRGSAPGAEPTPGTRKEKGPKSRKRRAAVKVDERDCFTEAEFDALLADARGGPRPEPDAAASVKIDERDCFTEAEFDALLAEVREAKTAPGPASAPRPTAPASARGEGKRAEPSDPSIRIDIRRLDDVMNLVGELVLDRNRVVKTAARIEERSPDDALARELAQCAAHLDHVSADLQAAVMKTRMIPIKKVFGRFPRMVRDLARELGKEIELEVVGEETELDKSLVEEIGDPLVHLLRNSADHGIEAPEARERAGKPRKGAIRLSAMHEGDNIVIVIEDDGKGIDVELIRRKAVERGVVEAGAAERMGRRDVLNFIFSPGFSTADRVTDVSGRGVGMDVVKHNIAKLNGLIEIDTELGRGTRMLLKLPLTVAIIRSLMVGVGGAAYAVPLALIVEIVRLDRSEVRTVDGSPVIHLRDSVIPLIDLREALGLAAARSEARWIYVVIVGRAEGRYGLVVDRLHGLEELVIKSMGDVLPQAPQLSGATVNGDGDVILILNVPEILEGTSNSYPAAA